MPPADRDRPDWSLETPSPEATREFARSLAGRLRGGEIILLQGALGSGKTCFTGGLAEGLGIEEAVVSPTFVIHRSYASPRGLTLHHLDFYRLAGDVDLETAAPRSSAYTPVPGGVGPMTIVTLMRQTVEAAERAAQSG